MRVNKTIFLGISTLLLLGCKKEVEKKIVGSKDPVFWLVSSDPSSQDSSVISAGDHGYYMETSFGMDTLGLPHYSGLLVNTNGRSKESFEFIFRANSHNSSREFPDINTSISVGEVPILDNNTIQIDSTKSYFSFEPNYNSGERLYDWNFMATNDSSNISNPSIIVDTTSSFDYAVSLVTETATCNTKTTKVFHDLANICSEGFTVTFDPVTSILTAKSTASINPNWIVNKVNQGASESFSMVIDSPSTYLISATFNDPYCKNTTTKEVSIWDLAKPIVCENDFTVITSPVVTINPDKEGSVEIIYTDPSGEKYYSSLTNNPGTFTILDISEYKLNVNGDKTKKITFEGTFALTREDGKIKPFAALTGVIAVAYP